MLTTTTECSCPECGSQDEILDPALLTQTELFTLNLIYAGQIFFAASDRRRAEIQATWDRYGDE